MFKLLVLLSAVACALGAAIPDGMVPQLDGRIVGGSSTTISNYPYIVSLQRSGAHSCGASIYSTTVVVTAAHCVKGLAASTFSVRAGSTNWSSGGYMIQVRNYKIHDNYSSITKNYDVAVVRLSSTLNYSSNIKAISLATSSPSNGISAVVTGWGTLSTGGITPNELQFVNVNIISQAQCSQNYGYSSSEITTNMICASATNKDACQGDSGGPLVTNNILSGIVSWGYGCAQSYYPGVYTNVASVYSWIVNSANTV